MSVGLDDPHQCTGRTGYPHTPRSCTLLRAGSDNTLSLFFRWWLKFGLT